MLRLLLLISLCAVLNASLVPHELLNYPRSLRHLFEARREAAIEEKKNERETCKTEECKLIAQVIKDSMDVTVNPCDDFYQYTCGNWSKINPVPENRTQWSLWLMVKEKIERQIKGIITGDAKANDLFAVKLAKKWYHSCMDLDAIERRGVEPILSTLWRHGGWPLIMEDGEWDESIYTWQIVDDQFARLLGFNAFHDIRYERLTLEANDTIQIGTPHLPMGVRKIFSVEKDYNLDSSDENNESGEGSQEEGSREEEQQQNDEDEDEDENENENEDEDEDENDSVFDETDEEEEKDQGKRKMKVGKHHGKLRHGRRWQNKKKMHGHINRDGRKRISKREIFKRIARHRVKATLSKHKHSSHAKLGEKRNNKSRKSLEKQSNKKLKLHKTSDRGKKLEKLINKEKSREKEIVRRKIAKRLGHGKRKNNKAAEKHVREKEGTKMKKMKHKLHNTPSHKHQKIPDHEAHDAMNRMTIPKRGETSNSQDDYEDKNKDHNEEEYNDDNSINTDASDEENGDNDEDTVGNDEDNEYNEDVNENEDTDEEEGNDDDNYNEDDDEDSDSVFDDDTDSDDVEEMVVESLKEEYKNYILNVSMILSNGRGIEIPRKQMEKDVDDLVEFIIQLTALTLLIDDEPVNMTLFEFQYFYKSSGDTTPTNKINWIKKVEKIFAEAGAEIDENVEVLVMSPDYIDGLYALLTETPQRVLVNYVHWAFINNAMLAGPEALTDLISEWMGSRRFLTRDSMCLQLVQLSKVAGYEYVKQYFSEDVAKSARDMIDDIQKEVEYQIKEATWMNEDTQHFILDKLVHMKNLVGYPSWYRNETLVKRYFQGLTVGTSFYENVLNYARTAKWKSLREILHEQEETAEDILDPLELNAFFMPTENSISITAADFQSPFFAYNRPWYVNFGIIGLVMGHEVNHGFDDSGHLYDKEGVPMEWLSAMAQAYNKRAKCFVDQYNRYSILKGENYTIKDYGNKTAGENIADTMGLHAVFRAYKRRERECTKTDPALPGLEQYTNDQLFFLSFGNLWCETEGDRERAIESAKHDVHSAARLRVIGPVSNSEDFAKAFNCPVDSPMNPKNKCNLWH